MSSDAEAAQGPGLVEEAERLVDLAESRGLQLRLIGGIGVYESCPSARRLPLRRRYMDIDLVARKGSAPSVTALLAEAAYQGDRRFNALHGERQMLFRHDTGGWQIDVFLGTFAMCHTIDLTGGLMPGQRVVPLADLLLTKLQIVELNLKDLQDVMAILLDHPISTKAGPDAIDAGRLTSLTSANWGLYTTVTDGLQRVKAESARLLGHQPAAAVVARADDLTEILASAPKSRTWRLRNRIGKRLPWYDLPDEVTR